MSDALTRDEGTTSHDIEDLIADYQNARGPQPNISYFAFTATPRNVTLERFGAKGADGLPQPFHLYSMRQAIEEGFILDVLQNCMTYMAYYQLEKTIEDDPGTERAQRAAPCRALRLAPPDGHRPEGRSRHRAFPPACHGRVSVARPGR